MRFEAGHPVRVEFTKWGGRPHWSFTGLYLGEDEHGEWIGHHAGTFAAKPDNSFTSELPWLTLKPRRDPGHLITINPAGHPLAFYVDMSTPPEWSGAVLGCVDLDLDVIARRDGTIFIDDEDEFLEHQVSLGYPLEIIDLARTTANRVLAEVKAHTTPYDGSANPWFETLAGLTPVVAD
ncbi:DUF402 domain-containing protein [Nocardioides sp. NPDC006273]|uniref:DUF402 domain-containing protein n=1 Tax=Nocardioides sp. NPDC006273 TaxID=3155598 RepID=UPI0033B80E65